jgi:hypothetical protein
VISSTSLLLGIFTCGFKGRVLRCLKRKCRRSQNASRQTLLDGTVRVSSKGVLSTPELSKQQNQQHPQNPQNIQEQQPVLPLTRPNLTIINPPTLCNKPPMATPGAAAAAAAAEAAALVLAWVPPMAWANLGGSQGSPRHVRSVSARV